MPDFEAANEKLGDQLVFVGLDVGPFTNLGSSEDGRTLVQELGVTYPVGTTPDGDIVKDYKLILCYAPRHPEFVGGSILSLSGGAS
jgi:hypothetical protein